MNTQQPINRIPEYRRRRHHGRHLLLLSYLPFTLLPVMVLAIVPTIVQAETANGHVLEEVVVTARHREESLQELSISASALSGDFLREAGVNRTRDLEYMVPNLVFGNTGTDGETFVGIRGVGDFSRNIGFDTRVGVYIDQVFVGQSLAINQAMVDVDRVETLRGPQGTLFGKNTSSGVISIVSKQPEPELGGWLELDVGNYDSAGLSGALNVPLNDTTAVRGSFIVKEQDGYVDNLYNGKELLSQDFWGARINLINHTSDALTIKASADYYHSEPNILFLEPTLALIDGAPKPYEVNQDVDLQDDSDSGGASLTIDYEMANGYILTAITGYRFSERNTNSDEDASPADLLYARLFHDEFDQFTQEVRLASPANDRYDFVVGAYVFVQDAESRRDAFGGVDFGGPFLAALTVADVDTESYALFINGNYHINDAWSINAGLRLNEERRDVSFDQAATAFFGPVTLDDSESDSDVNATLSIKYHFSESIAFYAAYSRGTKSGGWNLDFVPNADIAFDGETVDSFEIGFKSEWWDRRIRLNGATFYATYEDFQVFQFQDTALGTNLVLTNAGEVTSKGIELELTALPTDQLMITAGVGYTDASFDEFRNGGGIGVHFDGNDLARAPEWTGNFTAQYSQPISVGELQFRYEYSYRGDQYFNPNNFDDNFAEAYGLSNASIKWLSEDEAWQITAWGRNLADKRYLHNRGVSFLGIPFDLYGQPRTYGVTLRRDF